MHSMADHVRRKGEVGLILALASGATVRDAAKSAGVSERHTYRLLEDSSFRRQVGEVRAEMLSRACGSLADASTEAVQTLRGLLSSGPPPVRLGAAKSILELACKLRD